MQIDRELKFDQQVEMVANKANKMLGLIRVIYIPGWTNHEEAMHEPGQTYSRMWQCSLGLNTQERPTDD